jgi:hypothetical protein
MFLKEANMTSKSSGQVLLQGKVASILTARELTINIGREHGVEVGMIFKVLADIPVQVIDPDTNNKLGEVDREKIRVKVSEVEDKFSICKTYRTRHTGGLSPYITSLYASMLIDREEVETLKASEASLPPPLPEEESFVKRGDRVIQVLAKNSD